MEVRRKRSDSVAPTRRPTTIKDCGSTGTGAGTADCAQLLKANTILRDVEFEILRTYTVQLPDKQYSNAVISTDLATHARLLSITHRRCPETDIRHRHLLHCRNCQHFGHAHRHCNAAAVCRRCAGAHSTATCTAPSTEANR